MVALAPADDEVREALSRPVARQAPNAGTLPDVSLRARIFVTNAAVTVVAAVVLLLTPVTVSSPAHLREVAIVVGGLSAILVINLVLLRRAFGPLERMTAVMRSVELLQPGRRVPVYGQEAEIVDLTRAFNEMLERLEGEQRDSVRRSLEAQESERQRVARELHDEVGQSLTAVMLQLDRVARFAPDGLREEMAEAREAARSSLEDVRAIAQRLRPEALDDLGLPSALTALTDRVSERTGVRVETRFASPCPEMTPEGELVCYRIAQEAVTNALRHAEASAVCIALKVADGAVTLTVVDDGTGLDGAAPGSGIQGMRERALMIGADFEIESSDGAGTKVILRLPEAKSAI